MEGLYGLGFQGLGCSGAYRAWDLRFGVKLKVGNVELLLVILAVECNATCDSTMAHWVPQVSLNNKGTLGPASTRQQSITRIILRALYVSIKNIIQLLMRRGSVQRVPVFLMFNFHRENKKGKRPLLNPKPQTLNLTQKQAFGHI